MADYEFDPFDDGSSRRVGERQVEKMQEFASEYGMQLREIGEALDSTLSEVWDPVGDPIGLELAPYEQCGLIELVRTDNKLLNKLMLVFASLCLECKKLVARAHDHFIPVLLIAGRCLFPLLCVWERMRRAREQTRSGANKCVDQRRRE
jgi:WASH complex subunit 7